MVLCLLFVCLILSATNTSVLRSLLAFGCRFKLDSSLIVFFFFISVSFLHFSINFEAVHNMEFCTLFSVMDGADPIVSIAESHQSEVPNSGFDGVMEKVSSVLYSTVECERLDESARAVSLLGETRNFEPLSEKDVERSALLKAFGGFTIAKDSKEGDDTKSTDNSKKVQDRGTAIKHSNPKSIMTSVKSKDDKSGSITLNKPFALATNWRSSSDRQIAASIHSTVAKKVASAASAACHALQPGQSYTALPALSTREPQSLRELAKHKPPAKVEEYTHSASLYVVLTVLLL
ncbi:uncharacterized protein LOC121248854 [Juglans microcarpa x Juglans regia]|uniref:uncharacterized protein LOC121248854 n=1 Tax=Juglans microcarpa x Juglans regia TaxID=2249226 RepID=UPI001B7F16A9|nr:uncharacterized protein LOC121248854 [Juglans microcarpa x Juglans regia]